MTQQPDTAENRPAASVNSGRSVLAEVADAMLAGFRASLESLFSACDDLFFDLASRAKSNQDQNLYFESLREVRLKKNQVIEAACAAISQNFSSLEKRPATRLPSSRSQHDSTRAEDLQLVGREQTEKDVLITDMVSKARIEWQAEIFQLGERLKEICRRGFDEFSNPFDPGQITTAYVEAAELIDVDLKILKLLYKLFDRHVLRDLDETYHRVNQLLIDAGVLPNLSRSSRRKIKKLDTHERTRKEQELPSATKSTAHDGQGGPGGIPETDPETRELAQLLRRLREGGIRLPMFPGAPSGDAPPVSQDELLSLISEIQVVPAEGPVSTEPLDIRNAINAIIAKRGQISLGQADEDVINVVAMFFDIILDDRNLPVEIQALVSRLQLPILKVALKDRSFFTERRHPARQLINEIARTSIGWESSSKETKDALFIRLTELVEQVLHGSSDQTGIFDKCLSDLLSFIEQNEQRSLKVEKRTTERASAEAKTSKARDMVRHVLHERLEAKELPAEITAFLVEDWQQVLQLTYLKQGKDSPEWLQAVQTVDDLIWSVQPHTDEKSRLRLERMLPEIDAHITAGLAQTHSHPEDAMARLEVVRATHRRIAVAEGKQLSIQPLTEIQREQLNPVSRDEEKSWKEMTAVERQKVQYQALHFEYLKRVDEMPMGTWLLYDDLRRGTTRRCKLSARIDETQALVFVNRVGMQVYEKPRKAFAYDLQMGHARVLEDTPLFDRTIERISTNLRKMAGDSSTAQPG